MDSIFLRHAGAVIALSLLAPTLRADVIFDDGFDSGTGAWHRAGTFGVLSNPGEQLAWTPGSATGMFQVIGRSFDPQTLGEGETIRVTFDYTQTVASASVFRVGLYHTANPITADGWAEDSRLGAWNGTYSFVRDDSREEHLARTDSGRSMSNANGPTFAGTTIGSNRQQSRIQLGKTYQGSFQITRIAMDQIDTRFTLSEGETVVFSVDGTTRGRTATRQDPFNTLFVRVSGGTALLDNVRLIRVPRAEAAQDADVPPIEDEVIRYSNDQYRFQLSTAGFRYAFEDSAGGSIAAAHPQSGLLLGQMAGNTPRVSPVRSTVIDKFEGNLLQATVTTTDGTQAQVQIEFHEHYARFSVVPLDPPPDARFTFDFRTAPLAPVFGLGDYGSHADDFKNVNASCNGNVSARDQADLTGLVRDEVINQGSCRRFVTNFAIFPKQGFAQVLFNDGKKRVGFTESENRIGVADEIEVKTLYYFIGDMQRIYADYLAVRGREGYPDVKPRFDLFEVGWEAYGALGWDTFQVAVMHNIQTYLENGFPLKWGVVGSGFWPGNRRNSSQGTTVSFGMWDTVKTPRRDGLPNPRYPNPDELKQLFRDNDMKLLLGLRNHFKTPEHASYNVANDGIFPREAYDLGFFLKNRDGRLLRTGNNQFPGVPVYFFDSYNKAAMDWFVEKVALWGVDGFKEDAMIYDRMYHDGMWNPFNKRLMEEGYLMIARNTAFSPAGDLMRINDSYAGTGQNFHTDPHRIPLNMLSNAASAGSNGYPDIIGGTPRTSTTSRMFREYYVRNAMLAAVSAGMSFGRGPWLLEHPEYEAIALKAALWHDRYAPYIFSAAIDSHETGYPHTMTPLHIAFPKDPETYNLISRERQQYQWMLGPSMLAAPLFGNDFETAESRDVYLPEGRWIDYESGTMYEGPTTLKDFPMPRARIPIFIGGKGVIVGKSADVPDALEAEVFPVTEGFSEYTYTDVDGVTKSRISNKNAGWNQATLKIRDLTNDEDVASMFDPVRGSFRFLLTPGRDYDITGGQ